VADRVVGCPQPRAAVGVAGDEVELSLEVAAMAITAYLDTANWYDLVEAKVPPQKFELAVRNGSVTPVLSFIHLMEFASRDEPYRYTVTSYIDQIIGLGEVKWMSVHPAIAQAELRNAFLKYNGLTGEPVSVFAGSLVDVLTPRIPGLDKAEARTYSVTKIVETLSGREELRKHKSFRKANPVAAVARLRKIRAARQIDLTPRETDYVQKHVADMPQAIDTPAGIRLEVTSAKRNELLNQLQWEDCPAMSLRVAAMDGWSLTIGGEAPSDFEDIFHLAALFYCDVVFADKRTCEVLSKGKAFKMPLLNSQFQDWLNRLII